MLTNLMLTCWCVLPLQAPVESGGGESKHDVQRISPSPMDGLWPSQGLMRSLIFRWSDSVIEEYELDGDQRDAARDAAAVRWGKFLQANRAVIQPLVNEFIEMRVDVAPPTKETIRAWAGRALPVLDLIQEQVTLGRDDFRKVMNEVQKAQFEREALRGGIGMQIARHKLQEWEKGDVDLDEFWERPQKKGRERTRERRQRQREMRAVLSESTAPVREQDQISLEMGAWEKYVLDFIQKFELDEGQRAAALSCLGELKHRAAAHRDTRREDIAVLEARIRTNSGGEQELKEIKQRLVELYGPIDAMFSELKHRIELIRRSEQRAMEEAPQ